MVDLGDRVLRASVRAEPVRARLEIRLEDGLEHQLQARLDHPVGDGGNSELPELPDSPSGSSPAGPPPAGTPRTSASPGSGPGTPRPRPGPRSWPRWPCRRPAVRAPLFADTRSHASARNAGSYTRLNRSPNRRRGSSPAQRCSLTCIPRTATLGRECIRPGHGAGIHRRVFGHCSLASCTDTLPPFPMCTGFPRPGVLRRLRPIRAFGRRRAYPSRPAWTGRTQGTCADGSHVHCCPVDGLGTRLCPCGIATATPQAIHRGLRAQAAKTLPGVPRPS